MSSEPIVSIIIPVYNGEKHLGQTIENALAQSYRNVEVVVIDDGSSDDSLKVAKSFSDERLMTLTQKNSGGCAARNKGFEHASGDYIQFLDADDLMSNDKIEKQVLLLEKEGKRAIAHCAWERFYVEIGDHTHPPSKYWKDFDDPFEWLLLSLKGKSMIPSHAWLTHRDLILDAGKWNQELKINQDGEFFSRVAVASSKICFEPSVKVYYRSGLSGSVSQTKNANRIRSAFHSYQLIADTVLRTNNTPKSKDALRQLFQNFVYDHYPYEIDTLEKAENLVTYYGGWSGVERRGKKSSGYYKFLEKLIGWKLARRLKYLVMPSRF